MSSSNPADHYLTLELPLGASQDDVKGAFRRLSRIWHPDRNGDPEATKRFQAINNAYQALCAAAESGLDLLGVQAPLLRVYRTMFDPSSLQLNWGPGAAPDYLGGSVYRVEVRIVRPRIGSWTLLYEGPNTQFTATDASPECDYEFRVRHMKPSSVWSPIARYNAPRTPRSSFAPAFENSRNDIFFDRLHRWSWGRAMEPVYDHVFELELELLALREMRNTSYRHRRLLERICRHSRVMQDQVQSRRRSQI